MSRWNVVALAVLATGAIAAGPRAGRSGGWGPDGAYCRTWDAKTIETISGEVTKVEEVTPLRGMSKGVVVHVKTATETIAVHLGPSWFVDKQDVVIGLKDTIEVTGSRVTFEGKPAVLAQTVKKGEETLTLRDADGVPTWAPMRSMRPATPG